jgi:hypothetical protein
MRVFLRAVRYLTAETIAQSRARVGVTFRVDTGVAEGLVIA